MYSSRGNIKIEDKFNLCER
ncbi:hypothetical protein BpHYR1_037876 [Brachionus plicatilis]|uniref:Uncharacterized protein n=1 Tax=Brachionus plicatilis TaxID=10195 RepID=A0A3M7QQB4_BRAPC|nr:hypothetical protein BpHYR1_037876 [Brachionus plicatilis]